MLQQKFYCMKLSEVAFRKVRLPLIRPYICYRTFDEFEPIIVEVRDDGGRGRWARAISRPARAARRATAAGRFAPSRPQPPPAARPWTQRRSSPTAWLRAGSSCLREMCWKAIRCWKSRRTPAAAVGRRLTAQAQHDIKKKVKRRLEEGFRTFKIKVGKDTIPTTVLASPRCRAPCTSRATMRLDANRTYAQDDASRFAATLDPSGIELFEQPVPCRPVGRQRSSGERLEHFRIFRQADLRPRRHRARRDDMCRCQVVQTQFKAQVVSTRSGPAWRQGSRTAWSQCLATACASELQVWMEGSVAHHVIRNAGEFNGFLKPKVGCSLSRCGLKMARWSWPQAPRPR